MRILILGAVLAALLLVGCASPHTITFKDGSEMTTTDTPAFNERTGFYEFQDQDGRERFFRRFTEARWLRSLAQHFGDVVDRARVENLTWTEFLRDEWFDRN